MCVMMCVPSQRGDLSVDRTGMHLCSPLETGWAKSSSMCKKVHDGYSKVAKLLPSSNIHSSLCSSCSHTELAICLLIPKQGHFDSYSLAYIEKGVLFVFCVLQWHAGRSKAGEIPPPHTHTQSRRDRTQRTYLAKSSSLLCVLSHSLFLSLELEINSETALFSWLGQN